MQALAKHIQSRPGLTNAQWAERLGVSRPYLHALLNEDRQPSLETAVEIERATNGEVPVASWPSFAAVVAAVGASAIPQGNDVVLPDGSPALNNEDDTGLTVSQGGENHTGSGAA
jgi:DNA-binding transcriptional regulator YdaS (Cro superfamily)